MGIVVVVGAVVMRRGCSGGGGGGGVVSVEVAVEVKCSWCRVVGCEEVGCRV